MRLTDNGQRRAVRWYIGDVTGTDPFWGDPNVYVTINALFFPGTAAECARAREGKRLNPAVLEDPDRLYHALADLLDAFAPLREPTNTWRVERFSDYCAMRQQGSRTLSFTSTSTAGFLQAYQDRVGIALMQFALPAGTPVIDMSHVLESYAKPDEAEILLPPGLRLTLHEMPVAASQTHILDANGDPPCVSVRAVPCGMADVSVHKTAPDPYRIAGIRVLRALAAGKEPDPADALQYSTWKRAFVSRLLRTSGSGNKT